MKKKMDTGMYIRRLDNALRRRAEESPVLKQVKNMSMMNGWLIVKLDEKEKEGVTVYQRDLENELGITRSAISRQLKLMEEKGLVTRPGNGEDARQKKIELTDKARKLAADLEQDGRETDAILLKGFTAEEVKEVNQYLQRLIDNIEGNDSAR